MKKLLSIFLIVAILFTAAGICYAETEAPEITEEEIPGDPPAENEEIEDLGEPEEAGETNSENVDKAVYEEEDRDIPDDPVPGGSPQIEIAETKLPAAGGVPAGIFFAAGGLFIIAALILVFARRKAAPEN
jgi:hypothetical protein